MTREERRRSQRFIVVDLELFRVEPEEHLGRIVNLSENGMLAFCEEALEPQTQTMFRIPFQQTVAGKVHFDFEGKVVWAKMNATGPSKYSIGLEFVQYPDLQIQFIQHMIKLYGEQAKQ
jgi:hypothetical protein